MCVLSHNCITRLQLLTLVHLCYQPPPALIMIQNDRFAPPNAGAGGGGLWIKKAHNMCKYVYLFIHIFMYSNPPSLAPFQSTPLCLVIQNPRFPLGTEAMEFKRKSSSKKTTLKKKKTPSYQRSLEMTAAAAAAIATGAPLLPLQTHLSGMLLLLLLISLTLLASEPMVLMLK